MIINSGGAGAGNYLPLSGGAMTGVATLYEGSTISTAPSAGDNSTKIPTTAWVNSNVVMMMTSVDNKSVTANEEAAFDFSIAKEGCTPIGCCGYYITNASSSGVNYSRIQVRSFDIGLGSNTFHIEVRNRASTAAKIQIRTYILYRRNEA